MLKSSFLFGRSDIELEIDDISILNYILLTLLPVLAIILDSSDLATQPNKIIITHSFSTDEASLKISMDSTSSLRSLAQSPQRPTFNFIITSCEKVDQIHQLVTCLNYIGDLTSHSIYFLQHFLRQLNTCIFTLFGRDYTIHFKFS